MKEGLLSTVAATKKHILERMEEGETFFLSDTLAKEPLSTPPPMVSAPKSQPRKLPPPPPPPQHKSSKPPPQGQTPAPSSSMLSLMQKANPNLAIKPPLSAVVLFAIDEPPQAVAFLEKVRDAITPLFGEVSIVKKQDLAPFSSPLTKLIITSPYPFVRDKVGQLTALEPIKLKTGPTLFPIHEITSYLTNTEQKRALWTALKSYVPRYS